MVFQKRYLPQTDNIFQELSEIRKKRCVSLEKIHRKTKIPLKYLKALEAGSVDSLPDVVYVKNIIKQYLGFFNIDAKPYLAKLEIVRSERTAPERNVSSKKMIVMPRVLKTAGAIILVLGFMLYLGLQINKIFQPPKINIFYPAENAIVNNYMMEVRGKTDKDVGLFINNEQVILDEGGKFKKEISLQKGLNLIKISGVRRYSKENIIWRNVVLEIK